MTALWLTALIVAVFTGAAIGFTAAALLTGGRRDVPDQVRAVVVNAGDTVVLETERMVSYDEAERIREMWASKHGSVVVMSGMRVGAVLREGKPDDIDNFGGNDD